MIFILKYKEEEEEEEKEEKPLKKIKMVYKLVWQISAHTRQT